MMLYKPLVSLLMVFAATSSVVASATPVRRDQGYPAPIDESSLVRRGGVYPAPSPPAIAPEQCTGTTSPQCCDGKTSTKNPLLAPLLGLLGLNADSTLIVGLECNEIIGSTTCQTNTLCCQNVQQNGIANFNCVPINVAVL